MQVSASRYLKPPSPSLATRILPPRGRDLGGAGFRGVDNYYPAAFALMFDLVVYFFRCPWLEGETTRALLKTSVAHRSLAVVRPEEKSPCDFTFSRCGVGLRVDNEKVGVGTEGLVVVYVRFYVILQVDKAVYHVVMKEFAGESGLEVGLSESQNLAEVFPGDAKISKG